MWTLSNNRMAPMWEEAQRILAKEKNFLFTNPKKILLFPGLVSQCIHSSLPIPSLPPSPLPPPFTVVRIQSIRLCY